jgi:hypothetical protein
LLATGLNNLGIATVVAGAIGALIAKSYGAANADALCYRGVPAFVYISGGVFLMFIARLVLKDLVG